MTNRLLTQSTDAETRFDKLTGIERAFATEAIHLLAEMRLAESRVETPTEKYAVRFKHIMVLLVRMGQINQQLQRRLQQRWN